MNNAEQMISPFTLPPDRRAQLAAKQVIERVHAYMQAHPESELHRQGKMFGVLVYRVQNTEYRVQTESQINEERYLAAFSAQLDGSYTHEGFVPPVWKKDEGVSGLVDDGMPVGHSKEESQRLQRLLFANYRLLNGQGEEKNLLEIFANEKPIVSAEEWFGKELRNERVNELKKEALPPSGAGDCCAPKLLQYAFTHGLKPLCLAEFWVGAPSRTEIRKEGCFYAPCSGKCVPILRHMLKGVDQLLPPRRVAVDTLCKQMEIIYEDDYLLVVNKPPGLLSVAGKGEEVSVESYWRLEMGDGRFIKAVHRLDQDTSGLLVLAKTPEIYKELQAYFQRRDILKRYEAVVQSSELSAGDTGTIDLPLLPNPYDRPRQMVDKEHGKPAITRYTVRERRADGTCLVDFYPLTGRTHQIRVHAAHPEGLHASIVGDRLYGEIQRSTGGPQRMMLHAAEIQFIHPQTNEKMHFCIPSRF